MRYETKTALVLRKDLLPWQIANVAGFLAGGLAGAHPEMAGEPYADASGRLYTPLVREPIFVYGADSAELVRTYQRAVSRNLRFAIYTEALFKTNNDHDNRAAVAACTSEQLNLVGIGLHADRRSIDKIVNGLRFLA